jgi:putative transcriptional regulator
MNDGSTTKRSVETHDWSRFQAMSDAERTAAAHSDIDAQPIEPAHAPAMKRTPQIKVMCRALGLSLDEFAAAFQIPRTLVEDWAEGRSEPDLAMKAYLRVIGREPDLVRRALAPEPATAA